MKISIITVCYNSERFIERCIKSVLSQDWQNFEYIIIDGGSTDNTIDIIKEYEADVAYWKSEPDKGISDAFNKGLNKVTGDIIGILNSDDFYEPNMFKEVIDVFNKEGAEIVCGGLNLINTMGKFKIVIPFFDINKPEALITTHPATFVKKEVYNSIGVFDTRYRYSMDYDFFLRYLITGKEPVCLQSILSNMQVDGESYKNYFKALRERYQSLMKNNFNTLDVRYRMIAFYLKRFFKIYGSRIKHMFKLSNGPLIDR